jgi:hypothetical protein
MEECSGRYGEGLKEIRSASVDWEKHLCSCTETVPFNRQHSRATRLLISLWSTMYKLRLELLVQLTVRFT